MTHEYDLFNELRGIQVRESLRLTVAHARPERAGPTDEGETDATENSGSLGSLLGTLVSARNEPGVRTDDLRKPTRPEVVQQRKYERPAVPSEPSARTEQICDHP